MAEADILQVINISKRFIAVQALDDVSITFKQGEIHALVGENGAGKSTLSKIISGVYTQDSGKVLLKGEEISTGNPRKMQEQGIFMIPQDLGLLPQLSVMDNIFLGRENRKFGIIDKKQSRERCREILETIDIALDLDTKVGDLSLDQQQFVALARVLSADAEIIILDESTATLSEGEVENLFDILKKLKKEGMTMIYISHRLEEIFELCDTVTVLKDGKLVKTAAVSETNRDDLIVNMVGRSLSKTFPSKLESTPTEEDCIIKLEDFSVPEKLFSINLDIYKGEILGIGGLAGMGQTVLVNAIFGNEKVISGSLYFEDKKIDHITPSASIERGIYYISSDRRAEMLFMPRSVQENISIATMGDRNTAGVINKKEDRQVVEKQIAAFNIVSAGRDQPVMYLSGGNQQKVILARWMVQTPKVLILDEPTQGIDVGTKEDIYKTMRSLAEDGIAIIVVFSDMIELLGMCDRIAVLAEGRLSRVFTGKEATEEKVVAASCVQAC
jgi:ribose transport system ATP-binding protein